MLATDESGPAELETVIDGVNALIEQRDYAAIDRAIKQMPKSGTNRFVLVGLARATFPVRTKLNAWRAFILRCRANFASRGLDANQLLKGLL